MDQQNKTEHITDGSPSKQHEQRVVYVYSEKKALLIFCLLFYTIFWFGLVYICRKSNLDPQLQAVNIFICLICGTYLVAHAAAQRVNVLDMTIICLLTAITGPGIQYMYEQDYTSDLSVLPSLPSVTTLAIYYALKFIRSKTTPKALAPKSENSAV